MTNVCIVRHQGYIKSKMRFPYQHNFRTLKSYGNKNLDVSLTHLNTCIVNNLKDGETYLTAFNRLYESGEFKGQLKVQGEMHDFGEAEKHLEVEAFKLKEAEKSLNKLEAEIKLKEQSLVERAKVLEPEEHISIFNIKDVVEQQKTINLALKMEKDKNALLLKEKESLNQTIKDKDELILVKNQEIQNQQEKVSEIKKELSLEKDKTNDILNIKIQDERLRQVYLNEAKQKIRLYDLAVRIIKDFLPELIKVSPKFIRELLDNKILHKEDLPGERENNRHKGR